ncbi:MAG: FG-GAP-like repeat-containing protein [Acidobacteriota bacterium]
MSPRWVRGYRFASLCALSVLGVGFSMVAQATSVIPITDQELFGRATVVVHGIVQTSDVTVDGQGRPETLTVIAPISVLKGQLTGSLVLHQLGGTLPDQRFLKIWGQPEYLPGREVVVFAIPGPEGEYQTAEMLLGKFEVREDSAGVKFAVPDLTIARRDGVSVVRPSGHSLSTSDRAPNSESVPRPLAQFLENVKSGRLTEEVTVTPSGSLKPVERTSAGVRAPLWANWSSGTFYRWSNGATALWTTTGTANITGGGAAEALASLAAWTNDSNSNINYTMGSPSAPNTIELNATSVCGQSGCLAGGGVIGCGGPGGGSSHLWRGDSYFTISNGFVQLRSYCTTNLYDSITTTAVIEHELGHTLGFGHSDQGVASQDSCRGDEDAAIMRSVAQHRTTLGTDDIDAIRWVYGGGQLVTPTSCASSPDDFTGDGRSDILWRNSATGSNLVWGMTGPNINSLVSLPPVADLNWRIGAVADFNGDGRPDVLWRNAVTGQNVIWVLSGTSVSSQVALPSVFDLNWQIAAAADMNGDSKADIIWRNTSTGANTVWMMNGTALVSQAPLPPVPDGNWFIGGAADFDRDGKSDLLWRNTVTGQNTIWVMNGTAVLTQIPLPPVFDLSWHVVGVADFTDDGVADILWRNLSTGSNTVWVMNATSVVSAAPLPAIDDMSWKISGPR